MILTGELVRSYRLHLNRLADAKGEPLKKNTQNYHLIALRAFLKYLAKARHQVAGCGKSRIGKNARAPGRISRRRRILNDSWPPRSERRAMIRSSPCATKRSLELLFSTGLRVSELCGLKRDAINLEARRIHRARQGLKVARGLSFRARARVAQKIFGKTYGDLSPYLLARHDRAIAHGAVDEALTPRSVQRLVAHYARAAGIATAVTPHTLRHSYATDLLRSGADIRSVQSMLGHSSITTTQIYTHVTNQHLREIHKKFHGKSIKDG
jgi:integrase/recombinase XerD